eukprot:13633104-Ditylum_brightwellii.AAC.1
MAECFSHQLRESGNNTTDNFEETHNNDDGSDQLSSNLENADRSESDVAHEEEQLSIDDSETQNSASASDTLGEQNAGSIDNDFDASFTEEYKPNNNCTATFSKT